MSPLRKCGPGNGYALPHNLTRAFPRRSARGRVAAESQPRCFLFLEGTRLKTKRVAGVDLPASSFAYVGDENDTSTYKLPLYIPGNHSLTRNLIKSALFRFADTKEIPDQQRAEVWRVIVGACRPHGIKVVQEPAKPQAPAPPVGARPLDAEEMELKQARAVGLLAAEKMLKRMGYGT